MDIQWNIADNYLIGKTHNVSLENEKIAAFDMDDTLIQTKSGKEFAENDTDWKLYDDSVSNKLTQLHTDGYKLVIVSNQMGITKGKVTIETLKKKLQNIINTIKLDFVILCAFKDDGYRKPRTKLWNIINGDQKTSFFCGDAGGLIKRKIDDVVIDKDFSDTDLKFAKNIGIRFIHRDEFIYNVKYDDDKYKINYPVKFASLNKNTYVFSPKQQEMIINVGLPGSGKSYYTLHNVVPCGYVYINQDTLKTANKCLKATEDALKIKKSVVIDNTNITKDHRNVYIELAKRYNVHVRCLLFTTSMEVCIHNSYFRNYANESIKVIPKIVYNTMKKKYVKPELSEGFIEIHKVDFKIDGKYKNEYQKYYY